MELVQGSMYKIVKSANSLFAVMLEHFDLKEKVVRAKLKECGFTSFKVEEWDQYILCLTGRPPCRYCGAPKQYNYNQVTHKRWGALGCVQDRHHYHMEIYEDLLANKILPVHMRTSLYFKDSSEDVKKTKEFEVAQAKAHEIMMEECIHGDLRHACILCISDAIFKRMEN